MTDTQSLCHALAAITGLRETDAEIITLASRCQVDYDSGTVKEGKKFLPYIAGVLAGGHGQVEAVIVEGRITLTNVRGQFKCD